MALSCLSPITSLIHYPKGRIPEDPDKRLREYAVKYSDYALGQFFQAAKKEAFWTNTIFVVVADHGARVYGKQSIPIHSYEIPLLIAGPAVVKVPEPRRATGLLAGCADDYSRACWGARMKACSSVATCCKSQPAEGRALLNHNRDIGLLTHDRLVVLGLKQTVEFYQGDPKVVEMSVLAQPTDADRET